MSTSYSNFVKYAADAAYFVQKIRQKLKDSEKL